jgi:hypothetical protein
MATFPDELRVSAFLQRLASLQRLCSYTDSSFPSALLFVLGQDGRNNRGSVAALNYLFFHAGGKDLFDAAMIAPGQESLEDIVVLVQQTSLSVVWT